MKCKTCGAKLTSNAKFCRMCGTPIEKEEPEENKSIVDEPETTNKENVELTANIDITKLALNNDNHNTNKKIDTNSKEKASKSKSRLKRNNKNKTENDGKEEQEVISEEMPDEIKVEKVDLPKENEEPEIIEQDISEKMDDNTEIYHQPKRKKSKKGIVIAILLLILIGCICGLIYMMNLVNSKNTKVKDLQNKNQELNKTITQLKEEEKKEDNDGKKLLFNGYEFKIDKDYSIINNSVLLNEDDYNIKIYIGLEKKYTQIKENLTSYKDKISEYDYNVETYGTKVIGSREYVVYDTKDSKGNSYLIAYTDLNEKDVIGFVIQSKQNTLDYKVLEKTNDIIAAAKKNEKVDVNHIDIIFSDEENQ